MERQDLNQEQKLQVILCGPLEKTERALLQRGDVEIKRGSSLNLMGEMVNEICDCDMIIVLAPELTAPEDVKACLRELPRPSAPPEALVIAVASVDSLNAAEHIRRLYPKVGMVWCCNLDFSLQALQAYHLNVDYFFLLSEANTGTLGIGLTRVYQYNKRGNTL